MTGGGASAIQPIKRVLNESPNIREDYGAEIPDRMIQAYFRLRQGGGLDQARKTPLPTLNLLVERLLLWPIEER